MSCRFGLAAVFLVMVGCGLGDLGNLGSDSGILNGIGGGNAPNAGQRDHTGNFIGTWSGHSTLTMTNPSNGRQDSQTSNMTLEVSQGSNFNQIRLGTGDCAALAAANDDTHATLLPMECTGPTDSSGCTLTARVTSGSFVRNGSNATLRHTGQFVVTGCSTAGTVTYTLAAENLTLAHPSPPPRR